MPTAARRPTRTTSSGISLPRFDARTRSSRRYRALIEELSAEVGGQLSPIDRALIAQAVGLALRAEQIREAIVAGEAVNDDEVIRMAGEVRRIVETLQAKSGKRKAPAGPTLDELFATEEAAP